MKGLWRRRTSFYTLSYQITGQVRPPGADLPFSCQVSGKVRLSVAHPSHQKSYALNIQRVGIARHRSLLSRSPFFDVLWWFDPRTRDEFITTDAALSVHRLHLVTFTAITILLLACVALN